MSIPFTPGNSFLPYREDSEGNRMVVSIPFTPGNSFLHGRKECAAQESYGVNPLHLGELISTRITRCRPSTISVCQSPSPRGTHFYVVSFSSLVSGFKCQSPSSRGTHFYEFQQIHIQSCRILCQSPSPRGTHFYLRIRRA